MENHKRRRAQLEKLIQDAKNQVEEHESGRNLMESEEHQKVTKRLELYQRKLERMPEEPDEKVGLGAVQYTCGPAELTNSHCPIYFRISKGLWTVRGCELIDEVSASCN